MAENESGKKKKRKKLNMEDLMKDVSSQTTDPYEVECDCDKDDGDGLTLDEAIRLKARMQVEYLLSCQGYCVGLGNIWRFPSLVYTNHGGAYLIPFTLLIVILGIPLFYLETSFAQFSGYGPARIWRSVPIMKGIGYAMMWISTVAVNQFTIITAWALFYLYSALSNPFPWTTTNDWWHKDEKLTPAENFWQFRVLKTHESEGLQDLGEMNSQIACTLFLVWCVVFRANVLNVGPKGKLLYMSSILPYLLITGFCIHGSTQEGAMDGVSFYMKPDWKYVQKPKIWTQAATQIFFSLSISMGGLMTFGSKKNFQDRRLLKDTLTLVAANYIMSALSGFASFTLMGNMAHRTGNSIDKVIKDGFGIIFIVYPYTFGFLENQGKILAVLFFIMVIFLASKSVMALSNSVINGIVEVFPQYLGGKRVQVCVAYSFLQFSIGVLQTFSGGFYWFKMVSEYGASVGLILLVQITGCTIAFGYGHLCSRKKRLLADFELMLHQPVAKFFRISWYYVCPITVCILLIFAYTSNEDVDFGNPTATVWGNNLGMFLSFIPFIIIVMTILYTMFEVSHAKLRTMADVVRPHPDWGPSDKTVPYRDNHIDDPDSEEEEYSA